MDDVLTVRARLRQGARRECWSASDGRLVAHVVPSDLDALLTAVDAQAARLVAVEAVADAALAWWGSRGHPFEAEATAELERVVVVYRESGVWQKATGAVGAGEARDGE